MDNFLSNSTFFGAFISLFSYGIGSFIRKKTKLNFLNPLLISIIITIAIVSIFDVQYNDYNKSAKYISYLLTPATISLAIPLYEKTELLKKHYKAVLSGIFSGVLTSLLCILGFAAVFNFTHNIYITFLPKSITTAIGMGISEELGGYVSLTVSVIIITGILGNVFGETILKIFKINHPIARGIALGTASHAIGTSKAMELGEVEGAMSGLSIVVAGILTVIGTIIFQYIR